jgi:MoxR-like ATPase
VDLMEPAHFGEREAATDRVVSVAGGLRAEPAPDLEVLDRHAEHAESVGRAPSAGPAPAGDLEGAIALGRSLVDNLSRVLLGTPGALTAAAMAALSGGHLLIEDVPGVGKTVLARALASSLGAELSRVQGHPDLLPSDVTGVSVFAPDTGTWEFRPGPVFAHVVLVDELNRTPPRTQAALLETM